MIGMLAKKLLRHIKAHRANPFDANSRALLKEVEYSDSDACTAARIGEIYRGTRYALSFNSAACRWEPTGTGQALK
jgi:hypothetical protein